MKPKTILISGGTSGIGKATAFAMLEAGWNAAVFSEQAAQDKQFEREAGKRFGARRWQSWVGDVTSDADIKKIVAAALKKFKTLDALFNNAGVGYFESADAVDLRQFRRMMDVNVVGMARMVKHVAPPMKKQKGGQIINMSSSAGKAGHAKSEFYAATKSAVVQYSEGIRQELAPFGIKVATLFPGMVETGFWDSREYARRKKELWGGKDPVRLSPRDLAEAVKFVCAQPPHADVREIVLMPF